MFQQFSGSIWISHDEVWIFFDMFISYLLNLLNTMTSLNFREPGEKVQFKTIWKCPPWHWIMGKWFDDARKCSFQLVTVKSLILSPACDGHAGLRFFRYSILEEWLEIDLRVSECENTSELRETNLEEFSMKLLVCKISCLNFQDLLIEFLK